MAHFAELDENNIVLNVVVVNNEDILDGNGDESEAVGIAFLQNLFGQDKKYKQTSYNANFRKNYAGIGFEYKTEGDAFVFQPFPSWVYNSSTVEYEPPIPKPDGYYEWREDVYNADLSDPKTQGWVDVSEYFV